MTTKPITDKELNQDEILGELETAVKGLNEAYRFMAKAYFDLELMQSQNEMKQVLTWGSAINKLAKDITEQSADWWSTERSPKAVD